MVMSSWLVVCGLLKQIQNNLKPLFSQRRVEERREKENKYLLGFKAVVSPTLLLFEPLLTIYVKTIGGAQSGNLALNKSSFVLRVLMPTVRASCTFIMLPLKGEVRE